jgi:hypothetical protein
MNRKTLSVFIAVGAIVLTAVAAPAAAQQPKRAPASLRAAVRPPASLRAAVVQHLGADAIVTIDYGRPGVKGRKVWGDLVPFGLAPGNEYSKNKPFPWRAGANETTTFEVNKDILVEGQKLAAGKYGIHMIPGEKEWIVIFSKNSKGWGSFAYNQDEDALRVTVAPVKAPHQEWLAFGFEDLAGPTATAFLHWELVKVPFKIKIAE